MIHKKTETEKDNPSPRMPGPRGNMLIDWYMSCHQARAREADWDRMCTRTVRGRVWETSGQRELRSGPARKRRRASEPPSPWAGAVARAGAGTTSTRQLPLTEREAWGRTQLRAGSSQHPQELAGRVPAGRCPTASATRPRPPPPRYSRKPNHAYVYRYTGCFCLVFNRNALQLILT